MCNVLHGLETKFNILEPSPKSVLQEEQRKLPFHVDVIIDLEKKKITRVDGNSECGESIFVWSRKRADVCRKQF